MWNAAVTTLKEVPNHANRWRRGRCGMATLEELFKTSIKLSLYIYVLILLAYSGSVVVYVLAILVPLINVALHSWALPRAEDWIADDILGEPFATLPSGPEKQLVVIAYRTADLDAPENTLAGIRKARQEGACIVHVDVRFTKDNIAVLMHDERIDRSTDSSGFICDLTISQVKALDASSKHIYHKKYKGEMVPSLEEAVRLCIELQLKLIMHMWDSDEKSLVTVVEMYKKYPAMYETAAVLSFYPYFLYQVEKHYSKRACELHSLAKQRLLSVENYGKECFIGTDSAQLWQLRQRDACIVTALLWRPCFFSVQSPTGVLEEGIRRNDTWLKHTAACVADHILDWCVHHVVWYMAGISAVFVHKDVLCPDYLRHWTRLRMRVLTWTVNDCREKIYLGQVLRVGYMTGTVAQHRGLRDTPSRNRYTQSPPCVRTKAPPELPPELPMKPHEEPKPLPPPERFSEEKNVAMVYPKPPGEISFASSLYGSTRSPSPVRSATTILSSTPVFVSPVPSMPEPPPKPSPPSLTDEEALMIVKD